MENLLNKRVDFIKVRYKIHTLPHIIYPYRSTYISIGDNIGEVFVKTIRGKGVDNTDPKNPIINIPNQDDFVTLDTNQTITGTKIFQSNVTADSFVKSGGSSTQFLKADGSVDNNSYALDSDLHSPVSLGNNENGLSLASNQILSLGLASATTTGALSSADFNIFSGKQDAGNFVTLDTAQTITAAKIFSQDLFVNGLRVGRGVNANSTIVGVSAGGSSTGESNSFFGNSAGRFNTTGSFNTAIGREALRNNTIGGLNTSIGAQALSSNTTGGSNTAIGVAVLKNNTEGSDNTAIGSIALFSNTTGNSNTALGRTAGRRLADNTELTVANNSIFIGANTKAALNDQTNQIVIGNDAIGQGSDTVTIGNPSTILNKLFGTVIHADAVNADESATLGQVTGLLHNPVTLGTANGLSLAGQELSLGLASANTTGALSSADFSIFNAKEDAADKGQPNGYAQLDSGAKIPISLIPDSVLGQVEYEGTWNATTNTPTLPNTPDKKGEYYVVSTAGTFVGIDFQVGDWIISNGVEWEKVDNTDAVRTVFGRLGDVVANANDYNVFYVRHDTNAQGLNNTQKGNARTNINAEPTFAKNTGFNKNFGTAAGTVAQGNDVRLSNARVPLAHTHVIGDVTGLQTALNNKENAFAKNTGFNKNFGTAAGTVAQGNDSRFHAAATLGTANGLSLAGQALSLGLASTSATGALSAANFNIFNAKVGGSGTTNFLSKFTGAGTIGNSAVFENGGNVGIGTTNPQALLEFGTPVGNANLLFRPIIITGGFPTGNERSQSLITFRGTDSVNSNPFADVGGEAGKNFHIGMISDSLFKNSNRFSIINEGVERLTIIGRGVGQGNVGIGTTNPISILELKSVSNTTLTIKTSVSSGAEPSLNFFHEGRDMVSIKGGFHLRFLTLFGTQERMRITNLGNVGIGTDQPSAKLDVQGNLRVATVPNSVGDFITIGTNGILTRRTAAEVLGDIGASTSGGGGSLGGSGTANFVPKFINSTTIGNSSIFDNGNVGIGTTTPNQRLHLSDGKILIAAGSNNLINKFNSQGIAVASSPVSLAFNGLPAERPEIAFYRGARPFPEFAIREHTTADKGAEFYSGNGQGVPTMTMALNAGNVGIGTTTPESLLQLSLSSASAASIGLRITQPNQTVQFGFFELDTVSTRVKIGVNGASLPLTFDTNNEERLRITSAGNVGIGTTAPIDKMQIVGGLTLTTSLAAPTNTSIGSLQIGYSGTEGVIRTFNSSPIKIDTSGVERLRITSTGNVGIGTDQPSAKLDVQGNLRVATVPNAAGDYLTIGANGIITRLTAAQVTAQVGGDAVTDSSTTIMQNNTSAAIFNSSQFGKGSYYVTATSDNEIGNSVAGTILLHRLTGTAFTISNIGTNSNITFAISGTNLQATQSTGGTQAVIFSVVRITVPIINPNSN